jgi:hypothetical protein
MLSNTERLALERATSRHWAIVSAVGFVLIACHARAAESPAARDMPPEISASDLSATTDASRPFSRPPAPVATPPASPPSPPTWAEIVRRASQAWTVAYKARDQEKLAAVYTEDACIKVPGYLDACGRSGIEHAAQAVWATFPDARTAWSRAWLVDDVLGVESAWTGTNDGTVDPVIKRPTHRTAGAAVITLSWLTPDGRIREQHVYGDQGIVASELGGTGRPFDGLPTTRERHEAKRTPVEESNVELVRGAFTSPPTLAFSDDVELENLTRANSLPRKTTGTRWIGLRTSGLSNARVVVTHLWGVEDSVLCEYEATGTPKDPKPQALATVHGVEVFRIEEGRVTRAVRYEDSLELSPPPGLPPPLPSMAP